MDEYRTAVGLDGRYRKSVFANPDGILFCRGRWVNDTTVALEMRDSINSQAVEEMKRLGTPPLTKRTPVLK